MKKANEYYNKTINCEVRPLLKKFFEEEFDKNIPDKTAIDLGCGAGNETKYLIKKGFKVTAVDKEERVIELIEKQVENKANLDFIICDFEELKLHESSLITSFFSLFFCKPNKFDSFMEEITNNINKNGYFVGNFLGKEDAWAHIESRSFVDENKIREIFKDFEIIFLKEEKYYKDSVRIKNKFWHVFNVIAKKKKP